VLLFSQTRQVNSYCSAVEFLNLKPQKNFWKTIFGTTSELKILKKLFHDLEFACASCSSQTSRVLYNSQGFYHSMKIQVKCPSAIRKSVYSDIDTSVVIVRPIRARVRSQIFYKFVSEVQIYNFLLLLLCLLFDRCLTSSRSLSSHVVIRIDGWTVVHRWHPDNLLSINSTR
jgi:hypothetical protein